MHSADDVDFVTYMKKRPFEKSSNHTSGRASLLLTMKLHTLFHSHLMHTTIDLMACPN